MATTPPVTSKLIILVVTNDTEKLIFFEGLVAQYAPDATVYTASTPALANSKFLNAPPNIVISDLSKAGGMGVHFVDFVLRDPKSRERAIILADAMPDREQYLDELATGRVQFCEHIDDDAEGKRVLFKAINFVAHQKPAEFYLRFVAAGQMLITEGEKGDLVFIVKRGVLQAFKDSDGEKIVLGRITVGEFVGEMAYVNGEPRNANVEALEDCELVEIPLGTLEKVLYRRPGWSQKLLLTLSKRLKHANEERAR